MRLTSLTLAPLAVAVALSLSGCNSSDDNNSTPDTGTGTNPTPPAVQTIDFKFTGIDVPLLADAQQNIQAVDKVTINGKEQAVGYQKLLATGYKDVVSNETFGLIKDYKDQPMTFEDNSQYICNGTNDGEGSGLDYSSILQKDGKIYLVSQFECAVGAFYSAELQQDTEGKLSVKEGTLQFISQKNEFGGWVHCAGQTTPWQSHLSSEEYEPDAHYVETSADAETGLTGDSYYDETAQYWGGDISRSNPYFYGWSPEVTIDQGVAKYNKHYAMGRFSHELAYVMPDQKTVYMSDDGTNVGFFMFVADQAKDLSAGTLYAAKFTQTSAENGGAATLDWVNLGHASNAEIRSFVATKPKFSDIFSTAAINVDGTCPAEFKSINTSAYQECVKLNDVDNNGLIDAQDEKIASRLETRRFAAYQGATTELRKEEGITFNARDNKLYVAISELAYGMEDNKKAGKDKTTYDAGGNNHLRLPYNACGGVYELNVAANSTIGSDYVAKDWTAIVMGTPKTYEAGDQYEGNKCAVEGLASPDNVTFLADSDTLVIGEDTSHHLNNMVWAYNIKDKTLSRMLTTPLKAETTSPFWYKDVNGFGYLTVVSQHPLEKMDVNANERESQVGVIGPFKFK